MLMEQERNRIIFLNQMAGPLFRELAEDLAKVWPQSTLYTGHPDTICLDVLKLWDLFGADPKTLSFLLYPIRPFSVWLVCFLSG
jgi:hypothetical protein